MRLCKRTIDFCGEERRFKRTTNKALKNAMKGVEALQKELVDSLKGFEDKFNEAQKLRTEATGLYTQLETSKDGDRAVDDKEELKKRAVKREKDNDKALKLIKQAEKIEKSLEKKTKEVEAKIDEVNDKLIPEYGKVCELLLEPFEAGEFEEKYDSLDMAIAKNLPMFYDLYMANVPEQKIKAKIRQLIEAEHSESSEFQ